MQLQSQDLSLLLLQTLLDCLSFRLYLLICIISWLCCFPELPFIVFFLQGFWSKLANLLMSFSTTTKLPSASSPVSLLSCSLRFLVFPNLSVTFFSDFLSCLIFVFDIRLSFWVSPLVLRSVSWNPFIRSSRSCSFS